MSIQPEIIQAFQLTEDDTMVVRELESTCNLYSLTPNKLLLKWKAFALTAQCSLKPTLNYVAILKNSLQREFERGLKQRRTIRGKVATKRGNGLDFSDYGIHVANPTDAMDAMDQENSAEDFMSNMFGAPVPVKTEPTYQPRQNTMTAPMTPTPTLSQVSSVYSQRAATHVTDTQYNGHLPLPSKQDSEMEEMDSELTFEYTQEPIQPYRFMFEKIKDTAESMDERIDYIGSLIQKAHNIEEFGNPTRISQEAIYGFGIVCSEATDIHLSPKSIMLQTSRDYGMGGRVALNLEKVHSYTLFPGQVIGVKGINHRGNIFQVEELFMPPVAERDVYEIKENKTLDMIVACGPFTLNNDLAFKPLEDLLEMCQTQQPDTILLCGPFLSAQHPEIASGLIEVDPEVIMTEQVIERLETFLDTCTDTTVFLMPHPHDITHMYNLFPQPPFEDIELRHSRLHLIGNPSSLMVNGHSITMANVDTIFQLGKEEISQNPEQTDRFTRLVEHVLQQHTLYPLLPIALDDNIDSDRMVDFHLATTPDVLILPSRLKHFIKPLHGSVCINPGYLCKNEAAGTYARIILYPQDEARVRVDLKKL
ncbi:hypothetical protein INT47_013246 [Mucor saturninus]|uniref:DNA polymerase alpha subunit B n=1 Tax=Mucor saturninus TaxID=64648 RepID=A0A8H7V0V9_9FUNG|nr:hypothetical protein INT47_013246 [Mucor saturninus]